MRRRNREAERGYDSARYHKRKVWLNNLKSDPCEDCGRTFPPCAMDFHHRDPADKKFIVSTPNLNRSMEALEQELAKCDLLCACCHRIRHHGG